MRPDIKQKWLEALRSGKYQQGQRTLRTGDDKFCCLGVLCDILKPQAWGTGSYVDGIGYVQRHLGMFESMPGQVIMEEADLGVRASERLAQMNDEGESFEAIAEYIEDNL